MSVGESWRRGGRIPRRPARQAAAVPAWAGGRKVPAGFSPVAIEISIAGDDKAEPLRLDAVWHDRKWSGSL